jgi:hypothetical protein
MGEGKKSRRARAGAIATAVGITAPILFLGGAIARGAESSSGGPTSVSVTYTDGSSQQPAADGSTTSTTDGDNTGTTGNTGTPGSRSTNVASVEQVLSVSILPGQLTVTPASQSVSFTNSHRHGGGSMAGSLATVTVVDARGSLVGWRATVSLQSVAGVSAADLAKAKLCVSPDAPTVVAGNPPEVRAAQPVCGGAGDPLQIFFAPPNGGGGTFSDTASLTLRLPGVHVAGAALASLAVAVG